MADKSGKKSADSGVMANLPSTRPSRLSRRARTEGGGNAAPSGAKTPTPRKPQSRASAAKPAAGPAPAARAQRPRAVRAGSPKLSEPARKAVAGREAAAEETPARDQSGAELAVTVVKAAGEIAQIGATVAGQLIKRAAGRLPRP